MPPLKTVISSVLIYSLLATSFTGPLKRVARAETQEPATKESGLNFRLSSATDQPEQKPATKATSTDLSQSDIDAIVKRLPPIKVDSTVSQEFALRERSLPPPRTGNTVDIPFPASAVVSKEEVAAGPLEVVRYSPEGTVPIAPELSVTFSQPMIALTSQDEAVKTVPVKLNPQPPGKWHWVGTKTLLFQPDVRFPMATTYVVTVPAGTRAANGGTLANEKSWTFTTPPLTVKTTYPTADSTQPRDALMFMEFDQRIDPGAVLRAIRVNAGNRNLKTRLATDEEVKQAIARDPKVKAALSQAVSDRWIAFRAIDPKTGRTDLGLPPASRIKVSIATGAPSAEGPNLSQKSHEFFFNTYGSLRVTEHGCNGENRCGPFDSFDIDFNNPLSEDFDASKVRIEPALDEMEVSVYDSSLTIEGLKRGNTTYRVTLDKSIKDQFNQTLGRDLTVEFKVGPSPRRFVGPGDSMVVMDPAASTRCSVFSINFTKLDVRLYSVTPNDWPQWISYQRNYQITDPSRRTPLPGKLIYSKTMSIRSVSNDVVETMIDLSPGLTNGHGQMILVVRPWGGPVTEDDSDTDDDETWIQVTGIGLDAFIDHTDLVGWVTSLKDGSPLTNVDVTLLPANTTARSGPDGLARMALTPNGSKAAGVIVASRNGDVAILPEEGEDYWAGNGWSRKDQRESLRWFVFDDRKMYQPGEEVHVKGWIRKIGAGKTGDVGPVGTSVSDIVYTLTDSRGNKVKAGTVPVNALGGFDWAFKLPKNANLGNTTLMLQALSPLSENTYTHNFQIQEFRRPEFEVKAENDSEGPFFVGAGADVTLTANYYAGGGLPNAPVNWSVTASTTDFTPPNRGDFTFGDSDYKKSTWEKLSGVTDANGKHRLHINFDSVNPVRPAIVIASASVTDVNRQTWSSETRLLVHPADLYVGLKSDKTFVEKGQPLIVNSIVTDLDGNLVAGREIRMVATRLKWEQQKGEWTQVETDPQECLIRSSASAVDCSFQTKESGQYRVKATVRDDRERPNQSELKLWVSGIVSMGPPDNDNEEEVELIPDRHEYKPGDTAQILVQAPFYPAEGVLTVQRSGLVKVERFRMDGPTKTLQVGIEQSWIPNAVLQVDLVGATEREPESLKTNVKRPAFASGYLHLSIPANDRRLSLTATPRDKTLEPGGETSVTIDVKDARGAPVLGGEVAIVVVDEAVLALTNYKLDDPISVFYQERRAEVDDLHLRKNLLVATAAALTEGGGGPGGGSSRRLFRGILAGETPSVPNAPPSVGLDSGGGQPDPIRVRNYFNALAVFVPSVPTDINGRAEVKVKLPDNLTRYRVMAVAAAGSKQFGSAESSITARMPLMVRASAPRFLNFGDSFEFPIVVQNQTDNAMAVDVALRASNARVSSLAGRRVSVPANDRVEVRIPVSTATAGTAHFQVAATSGRWSDAAEVSLPVWTPATTEAFAAYGEVDRGAISQPVKPPADVFTEFGGLEIETSSTQLQQLTDAFLYLQNYPYECSEQLASRILSVAALRDVLTAFKANGLPPPAEIEAAVERDLKRLEGMQNEDGGFGFWKRGDESWPILSIHVAHALARAQQKQFPFHSSLYYRAQRYLQNIESHIPSRYGPEVRRALIAYALYVRMQMGDRDIGKARKLLAESQVENLSLETIGWLLSVLSGDEASRVQVEQLRRNLKNRVTETASTAHFVCSYDDDDHLILNSNRRADAVVLEALIGDQPDNDLIPKIVRGLLDNRTQGRWSSTQENVFVLLALDRYFKTYEKVTPDFIARVWLGNAFAGERAFKGRSTDRQRVNVPMRYLTDNSSTQDLILSKEGAGRLYYRLAMSYAPVNLSLNSADYGFSVERTYEAIDDQRDVQRDSEGAWHIRAGARVRVRLTMVAPSRRYHVALVDYLPAGFESLNPELAVTERIPEDTKKQDLWRSVWFDHQNLRDERSEAFTTLLWGGVYNYSYVVRATTPGQFIVPAAKAEEMYHPETFGRSKTDRVRIE
jgi:alpha-2-macroglobulin